MKALVGSKPLSRRAFSSILYCQGVVEMGRICECKGMCTKTCEDERAYLEQFVEMKVFKLNPMKASVVGDDCGDGNA